MVDASAITAIASTVLVTTTVFWGFSRAFGSKANKSTTDEIFKMVNADRADIGSLNTNVAVMAADLKHFTDTLKRVDENIEAILKNGK